LEPPASDIELDRVEGLGPHPLAAAVGARDHPAIALEVVHLERTGERIYDPEVSDLFARIDAHLAAAVDRARRRRQHLADPVGRLGECGDVRKDRHPLPPPGREVGHDHVLAEVQLGLEKEPPPARDPATGRPVERAAEVGPDAHRRERVRRGGPRARHQLAVDDLRHQVFGNLHAAGFLGAAWPKEYGGAGLSPMEQAILNEELARARAPQVVNAMAIWWVGPAIIRYGTDAQKQRFIPPILTADEIWATGYS